MENGVSAHFSSAGIAPVSIDTASIDTVLCDLDGVVWLQHQPIRGSVDAVASIRATGRRVLFVTNNSAARRADHVASLGSIGIPAEGDVVSSAMASAQLVQPGERVLAAAGAGVVEALELRGAEVVQNTGEDAGRFDAVVVGLHREFDYDRLRVAGTAVLNGARLIGTNSDTTYPTPRGLEPGGGSLVAAVGAYSGATPTMAGKPEQAMADVVAEMVDVSAALMVGDRTDTDGAFAERLATPFALVGTGVAADAPFADLAAVAAWFQ